MPQPTSANLLPQPPPPGGEYPAHPCRPLGVNAHVLPAAPCPLTYTTCGRGATHPVQGCGCMLVPVVGTCPYPSSHPPPLGSGKGPGGGDGTSVVWFRMRRRMQVSTLAVLRNLSAAGAHRCAPATATRNRTSASSPGTGKRRPYSRAISDRGTRRCVSACQLDQRGGGRLALRTSDVRVMRRPQGP